MTDQRHCILWAGVVVLTLLLPPVTRDGNDYLWNNVHNFTDRRTQSLSKQGADLSKLDAFQRLLWPAAAQSIKKERKTRTPEAFPLTTIFWGVLNIVLYQVIWHILEGLVHLWTWMSPDKTDLFQDLTDRCWLLSEVQTFIMWFWMNLIRHETCFRFTVVVRSLETLTLNLNAMVILGLLIISLSCSFSKVERLYHKQY